MAQTEVILITGSSGLIGYPLAARLAERFVVVGFDREGPPHPPPTAYCISVDLTSEQQTAAAFEEVRREHGHRIASVVHLAAYYDFSGEPSQKYEEITLGGTERLLRHLREFDVEQFIFSSTMLVHASSRHGERISESSPIAPTWPYPQSKAATEALIRQQHGAMPILMMRIAGVYDEMAHSIPLAHQMRRIYERDAQSYLFPGDPSHGQAFVHLSDVVDAVVLAVERRRTLPSEVAVLVGEPDPVSYAELQNLFGHHLHEKAWPTIRVPKPLAKAGAWVQQQLPVLKDTFIKPWMIDRADDHYALDVSRARDRLNWTPRRSLLATLPAIAESLREDPEGWYRANHLDGPAQSSATVTRGGGGEDDAQVEEGQRVDDVHEGPGPLDLLVVVERLEEQPQQPGPREEGAEEAADARPRQLARVHEAADGEREHEQGDVQVVDVEDLAHRRGDPFHVRLVVQEARREEARRGDEQEQDAGDPESEDDRHLDRSFVGI